MNTLTLYFEKTNTFCRDGIDKLWNGWSRFWFESHSPFQLKIFRILFACLLLGIYLIRTFDLEFYFSNSGILPLSVLNEAMPHDFKWSLLSWVHGNFGLWALHLVFLASLVSLLFGWQPRISAIIAYVIHLSFLNRNMAIAYGFDLMSTFFLFYLCFVSYEKELKVGSLKATVSSIAFRLCQIQVCLVYAYSGLGKLRGNQWWNGQALWDVLANPQRARFDFSFLSHFPIVLIIATYLTLAWEIYFPVLVWNKSSRYPTLLLGALMHLGIAFTINLPFFGLLMIVSYSLFLEDTLFPKLFPRLAD